MKCCTQCKLSKSETEFNSCKKNTDGKYKICKTCTRAKELVRDAKRRLEAKIKNSIKIPIGKSCGKCNWFFDGQCAVKTPGIVCEVESSANCLKWERIQKRDTDNIFEVENFLTSPIELDILL